MASPLPNHGPDNDRPIAIDNSKKATGILSYSLNDVRNEQLLSNFLETTGTTSDKELVAQLLSLKAVCEVSLGPQLNYDITVPFDSSQDVKYRKIGFGQCGLIFSKPGQDTIVKVAKPFFHHALHADYLAHIAVHDAFARQREAPECRIPRVYDHIHATSTWWNDNASLLNEQHPEFPLSSGALISEYIPPLPKVVREVFIKRYCPEHLQQSALDNPLNRDCLARVYLGRRRAPNQPLQANFSLRNFNLHLDQMIEMNLPVETYARVMGQALAIIHWAANVDGYDIEFVLGSEASDSGGYAARMWVLDFNLCSRFESSAATLHPDTIVDQLVIAFYENDPYYPRPCVDSEPEEQLWNAFKAAYILKAEEILGTLGLTLLKAFPQRFIDACVERAKL
ncbi:hypothetical protein NW762_008307 [Fusarium torreyae]|uniref:DUF3669 domain-containing protein n=1 Tax=Fusarium torreyae TaxID=1237075 RepID=A0A9W8RYN5_9HYPO|nr:hypothetical protein NW762_008307 [Fusarium torreyae]